MGRLDAALQKYAEHQDAVKLLAGRDPVGNLKYLDWAMKIVTSGQALAPEVADVVELYDKYKGYFDYRAALRASGRRDNGADFRDIYAVGPDKFTALRDRLFKIRRKQDKKRRDREERYKIIGEMNAEVIYESDTLVVRLIGNKQASIHHGLNTKWCIAMKNEPYFEDYDSRNTVFCFMGRKQLQGDEFDRVAIACDRTMRGAMKDMTVFSSVDENVSIAALVNRMGNEVFRVLDSVYHAAHKQPPTAAARLVNGTASADEILHQYERIKAGDIDHGYEYRSSRRLGHGLTQLACSDEVPAHVLVDMLQNAEGILYEAAKANIREQNKARRSGGRRRRGPWRRRKLKPLKVVVAGHLKRRIKEQLRDLQAAIVVHANTPSDVATPLRKSLRRSNVDTDTIRIQRSDNVDDEGAIVMYENFQGTRSGLGHGSKKSRIRSRHRTYRQRHRVTVVDTVASVVVTMLGMRARRR